jgi:hypothetical protein
VAEESVKQRLLREAVKRAGVEAVAEALKVPPQTVFLWMRGHARFPDRKLLLLADLLDKLGPSQDG